MEWKPIRVEDETNDLVELRGRYPNSEEIVEIKGFYDAGGYTEGWVDEEYNWFYATHLRKIPTPPST